jgi:hypothetical protein
MMAKMGNMTMTTVTESVDTAAHQRRHVRSRRRVQAQSQEVNGIKVTGSLSVSLGLGNNDNLTSSTSV